MEESSFKVTDESFQAFRDKTLKEKSDVDSTSDSSSSQDTKTLLQVLAEKSRDTDSSSTNNGVLYSPNIVVSKSLKADEIYTLKGNEGFVSINASTLICFSPNKRYTVEEFLSKVSGNTSDNSYTVNLKDENKTFKFQIIQDGENYYIRNIDSTGSNNISLWNKTNIQNVRNTEPRQVTQNSGQTKITRDDLIREVEIYKQRTGIDYSYFVQRSMSNPNFEVDKDFYDDIKKMNSLPMENGRIKSGGKIIPQFSTSADAMSKLSTGDVCQVEGQKNMYIKLGDGTMKELKISAQAYLELFPPIERYRIQQQKAGDCWILNTIDLLYRTPETRHTVLDLFSTKDDGTLQVTIGNVTKDVPLGANTNNDANLANASKGFKAIEKTFGYDISFSQRKKCMDTIFEYEQKMANGEKLGLKLTTEYQDAKKRLQELDDILATKGPDGEADYLRNGGMQVDIYKSLGIDAQEVKLHVKEAKEFLEDSSNWDKYIFSAGSKEQNSGMFLNEELDIVNAHAYTIKPMYNDKGEIMVQLRHPHHTYLTTTITLDEFYQYFKTITIAEKK